VKWVVFCGLALAGLVALVFGVGALLPVGHSATVSRVVSADPETVWTAITDFEAMPTWRSEVDAIERRPDQGGLPSWTERSGAEDLSFETVEWRAPELFVSRIVGEGLPFGGTWRTELQASDSGTQITITEDGEVYSPVFRFVSRFVMGHDATMNQYLDDLEAYLGAS